jgi:hypothetical protein
MALRDPYTFHRRMIQVDFTAAEKAKVARKASQDKFYETLKEKSEKIPETHALMPDSDPEAQKIPAPILEVSPGTTEIPEAPVPDVEPVLIPH